jgi:hypothetical protein
VLRLDVNVFVFKIGVFNLMVNPVLGRVHRLGLDVVLELTLPRDAVAHELPNVLDSCT